MTFVPLNPIPLKDRTSMIFLQYGQIDVLDGAFVLIDKTGIRTHIPRRFGRLYHAGTGNAGFPCGSAFGINGRHPVGMGGRGGSAGLFLRTTRRARADKLLYQAKLALDDDLRLKVVRKMYELRFREPPPARRSVEQLRGIEGSRVRATYALLAKQYGVKCMVVTMIRKTGRRGMSSTDVLARRHRACTGFQKRLSWRRDMRRLSVLSIAVSASFVYDIADIIKFESVVPKAFEIAARHPAEPDKEVRLACREYFSQFEADRKIDPADRRGARCR
ncbi:CRISPR-associated protein Cas1 [Salmonella enterica subsp. enterica]|uniref:CRISPR-associated protein Cas1 n=1 Tax=Salmonella enterica I TaxID=59201 RepID=A0A379W3S8_SALET|nr:CRISPR-associated protein Cas1 [Salmonella enterica subsp. enterica]